MPVFDDVQTRRLQARRLHPMYAPTPEIAPALQVIQYWPWIAAGTVTLLLFVIARFSRRHSQFGERL
jgi:hypothetical protein